MNLPKLPANVDKLAMVAGYLAFQKQVADGHGDPFIASLIHQHKEALQYHRIDLGIENTIKGLDSYATFHPGRLVTSGAYAALAGFAMEQFGFKPQLGKKLKSGALSFIVGVILSSIVAYSGPHEGGEPVQRANYNPYIREVMQ